MLIEPFESRVMLSGNVAVKMTDAQIRFIGDAASNALAVTYSASDNQLLVAGLNGTTIDGKPTRVYAARDKVSVHLGAGDDVITLQRFSGGFNVGVDLGAGNDAVYFKRSNVLAADFFGGTGDDRIDLTDSTFRKRLRVFAGEQDDAIAMRAVRARAGLEMTDTAGHSIVAMKQVSASGESWLSGSNRRDSLTILDSDFTAFSAKLRDGGDSAYVRGTTFAQHSPIDGGAGTNDINREVILTWDFGNGDPQGWFAKLPPAGSSEWGSPSTLQDFIDRASSNTAGDTGGFGMQPASGSTGLSGSEYFVRADTPSSIARQIGTTDGLIGGRSYTAQVTAEITQFEGDLSSSVAGVLPVYPDMTGSQSTPAGEFGDVIVTTRNDSSAYRLGYAGTNKAGVNDPLTPSTYANGILRSTSNPVTTTLASSGNAWVVRTVRPNNSMFTAVAAFRTISVKLTPVNP